MSGFTYTHILGFSVGNCGKGVLRKEFQEVGVVAGRVVRVVPIRLKSAQRPTHYFTILYIYILQKGPAKNN